DPDQMAAAAVAPGAGGVQQALRLGGSSKSATIPTGCIRRIGGNPTLVAAGSQGCSAAATTYLEIDYDTGDTAKVTWTDNTTSFDLKIEVTTTTSGTGTGTATWSAGGDVEYDGAVAGNIVSKHNQLYVDWTDGTEDAFDPSALLGPAGV